ncbi:MAG: hypothetical protein Q9217_005459 [Psora testacea]
MPVGPVFQQKKFRPTSYQGSIGAWYRRTLYHHPFALFGLPFLVTMVAGSFFLTPATALRYEKHDRKVKQMTKEEELGIGKDRRKVDITEEYYRLAAKDLDSWEQQRVKRLPGEDDGTVSTRSLVSRNNEQIDVADVN